MNRYYGPDGKFLKEDAMPFWRIPGDSVRVARVLPFTKKGGGVIVQDEYVIIDLFKHNGTAHCYCQPLKRKQ